jgi:D-glutamate N-acetyltransferase
MIEMLKPPYLLFLGRAETLGEAKTAAGIAYWRRDLCCGQLRLPGCRADIGLPDLGLAQAKTLGARSLIIGVAPMGGAFDLGWSEVMLSAAQLGFDIVSGLHQRLSGIATLAETAESAGGRLIDVRVPPTDIPVANGSKRSGFRLLTVGTDCAVGKKYTALALARALETRGIDATFRATGQTGIMIAGSGIPIDAVVSDFVAGAAELLSPPNEPDHWDIVEGQGSLFHPSYAGVTLGLIHGTQPDALVLCHDLARSSIEGVNGYVIPPIKTCLQRYLEAARLTNASSRCIGISVNSSAISRKDYAKSKRLIEKETGLPCVDPILDGVGRLADAMLTSCCNTTDRLSKKRLSKRLSTRR